uniref:Methyltransferase type 11 domain-containing protein n=1 Tax=Oxyrrhis marina TaxID=2969 RepID=A0A7S4GP87_OXYMA
MAEGASANRGGMTEVMYNWRVAALYNALKQMGKETGDLTVEDLASLGHLDQYHYLGVEANDHVIDILGLDSSVNVVDIGSGIGGPARYISAKSGCTITGVELQEDLNQAATELTKRVPGLSERINFVTGDFATLVNEGKIPANTFDHFLSLLVFLHIPDRAGLLKACYTALKPGATFIIEDFMAKPNTTLTDHEQDRLRNVVSAPTVTTGEDYVAALQAAGFVDLEVVDLSSVWQPWTKARHELYVESKEETVKMHGEEIFNNRVKFYKVIDDLFAGNLGGCRITGRKPSALEAKLIAGRQKNFGGGGVVNVVEGKQRKRVGEAEVA